MPTELYQQTLAALRAQHPDTEISSVTYQVAQEYFDAQKITEQEEEIQGFISVIVLTRGGKVVLARKNYGTPGWAMPGGGVEAGESFHEAAQREILEELGVRLDDLDLLMIEEETFLSPTGEKAHSLLGVFGGTMRTFALPPPTEGAKEEGLELALFDLDKLPAEMALTDRDKIEAFIGADEE